MQIKQAGLTDIEALVENRMEFLHSIGPVPDADGLSQAIRGYLRQHIEDDSVLFPICLHEGRIVSSCCLCISETLPTASLPNGREGLLLNVYTIPEYRRQGLARKLIQHVMQEARRRQVGKITLDATDEGYPLYVSLGFHRNDRIMELVL